VACGISIKATAKLFLCTLCRHLVSGGTHYGPQHYVEVTVVFFFPGGVSILSLDVWAPVWIWGFVDEKNLFPCRKWSSVYRYILQFALYKVLIVDIKTDRSLGTRRNAGGISK